MKILYENNKNAAPPQTKGRVLLYIFLGFLSLYMTSSDVVTARYAHHDQTRYFREDFHDPDFKQNCKNDYQHDFLLMEGRFITAYTECLIFKNVNKLSDLALVRIITILILAISLSLAVWRLSAFLKDEWLAFFLVSAVFILPGMNYAVFHGNIPAASALLLSILAYFAAPPVEYLTERTKRNLWIFASRSCLSLAILIVALFTYPSYAYFFFALTVCSLLFDEVASWPAKRLVAVRDLAIVGASSLLYYALAHILIRAVVSAQTVENMPDAYKLKINADIFHRMGLFVNEVMPLIFNLWNIYASKLMTLAVLSVLLTGLGFSAVGIFLNARSMPTHPPDGYPVCTPRADSFRRGAEKILITLALFFAASIPWLMSHTNLILLRIFFPAMAITVFVLWWCASSMLEAVPEIYRKSAAFVLSASVFAGSAFYVNYNTSRNVWNSGTEYMFIRSELSRNLRLPVSRIHVIRPVDNGIGYGGLASINDEFNRKETDFWQNITEVVRIALAEIADRDSFELYRCDLGQKECVESFEKKYPSGILVTQSLYGEPVYQPENAVVVDMNVLVDSAGLSKRKISMITRGVNGLGINESAHGGNHNAARAFDGDVSNPDSFWETGNYPQWVEISSQKNIKVSAYAFHGMEAPERMPKAWRLFASNDKENWREIDRKSGEMEWKMNEVRVYKLRAETRFKNYRFVFSEGNNPILRIYEIEFFPQAGTG